MGRKSRDWACNYILYTFTVRYITADDKFSVALMLDRSQRDPTEMKNMIHYQVYRKVRMILHSTTYDRSKNITVTFHHKHKSNPPNGECQKSEYEK